MKWSAEEIDDIAADVSAAMSLAGLESLVPVRLGTQASELERVSQELFSRVGIARSYVLSPAGQLPDSAKALLNADIDPRVTVRDLSRQIQAWSGSQTDPSLRWLIAQRNRLVDDLFGPGVSGIVTGVASEFGIGFEQAIVVVLLDQIGALTANIRQNGDPTEVRALLADVEYLVDHLLGGDQALTAAIVVLLAAGDQDSGMLEVVDAAVRQVYGDESIVGLQEALGFHSSHGYGWPLLSLAGLHEQAVEDFTGEPVEKVNASIAGIAQEEGLAYNTVVLIYNAAIESGEFAGEPLELLRLNDTIGNDATLLYNLAARDLFTELETAKQRNPGKYDGKLSISDLQEVVMSPAEFSVEAVAAARYLLDRPELFESLDTASNKAYLDGLDSGSMLGSIGNGDGVVSYADIGQAVTNSTVFNLLAPVADAIDSDGDGLHSQKEFELYLEGLAPGSGLAEVVSYVLGDEAFSDRDRRGLLEQVGDGLWELNSLVLPNLDVFTDPKGALDRRVSFSKGLLWDFPKGTAVMLYDLSSLTPGSPAQVIEAWKIGHGGEHRGVVLLHGMWDTVQAARTLNVLDPAFAQEVEALRNSGRWTDHQGLGLAAAVVDWEGFVDDPSRWAGTMTGDILLEAATGAAMTGTVGGRRLGTSLAHLSQAGSTKLDDLLIILRRSRNRFGARLGHGFDLLDPPGPLPSGSGLNGGLPDPPRHPPDDLTNKPIDREVPPPPDPLPPDPLQPVEELPSLPDIPLIDGCQESPGLQHDHQDAQANDCD